MRTFIEKKTGGWQPNSKQIFEGESRFKSKKLKANADLKAKMLEQQHSKFLML
jgi:hypothetical protein